MSDRVIPRTHTARVLRAVRAGNPIPLLTAGGLTLTHIMKIITVSLEEKFIDYDENGRLFLTASGLRFLSDLPADFAAGSSRWIELQHDARGARTPLLQIYVPSAKIAHGLLGQRRKTGGEPSG